MPLISKVPETVAREYKLEDYVVAAVENYAKMIESTPDHVVNSALKIIYQAHDKEKRVGGLVLEVKGDFCHKVRAILERHNRAEDYIEINLNSEYRYIPLHNGLDAYALAYNIASLLNNLFGRGKETFWQQAWNPILV